MEYIRVKNFERFQHYRDRNPVWIKLYNELLDDYEFGCLPDASKMHLIAIWLLASRSKNKIPCDAGWIGKRICASEPVNLELLIQSRFLEKWPETPEKTHASNMLATCSGSGIPEEERETEEEKETPQTPLRGAEGDLVSFPERLAGNSELAKEWGTWVDLQFTRRRKPNAAVLRAQVDQLASMPVEDALACLRKTIAGNYQGLAEVKSRDGPRLDPETVVQDSERIAAETAERKRRLAEWDAERDPDAAAKLRRIAKAQPHA